MDLTAGSGFATVKTLHKMFVSEDTNASVNIDIQSVHQMPSSAVSQMDNNRKSCLFSNYSLMFKESAAPHKAFCYTWSEIIGQCRRCEISMAVSQ